MSTSKRAPKRATVYFDPGLHKALRVKAAQTDQSLSELVNAAIRQSLAEDAEDLAAFEDRAREPSLAFEEVLKDLKRRGKL
jgi:plasmid stability protein